MVNAQSSGSSIGTVIGAVFGAIACLICFVPFIIICLVRCCTAQNDRAVILRAQQGTRELSTTPSYALQQPHHDNSLSSEVTHNLENGVLLSTVPYTLESELQNSPPPTYSVSSRYPVYINEPSLNELTSHGEEPAQELPPPYGP